MLDVTPELIDKWKSEHGGVFKYETNDGKYAAIFRMPDRKVLGMSTTAPDTVAGKEIIANNCFLAGDREIIENDSYFYGLCNELPKYMKEEMGKSIEL